MNDFKDKIISFLPYTISIMLIGAILIVIYIYGLNFDQLISLIRVLIWPSIVLSALIFFRKVFTFFFFSLEEFNFFGTRGTLKNVKDVIQEKANELYKKQQAEEKLEKERKEQKKELAKLRNSKLEEKDRAVKAIELAENVIKRNDELEKKFTQIGNINRFLRRQLSWHRMRSFRRPGDSGTEGRIEDLERGVYQLGKEQDVGQAGPSLEASKPPNHE